MDASTPLFELRDYVTQPGRRDELIAMFEEFFLDQYECGGASILATFRRLDAPERWTWIRCFDGPAERASALNAFYSSERWLARREAANATIRDSDDSRLLRLLRDGGMRRHVPPRGSGTSVARRRLFELRLYPLGRDDDEGFPEFFTSVIVPVLDELNGEPLATFVTDPRANTYSRLPIREDRVFVTLTRFDSAADQRLFRAALDASTAWRRVLPDLRRRLRGEPESKLLQPTARSALR